MRAVVIFLNFLFQQLIARRPLQLARLSTTEHHRVTQNSRRLYWVAALPQCSQRHRRHFAAQAALHHAPPCGDCKSPSFAATALQAEIRSATIRSSTSRSPSYSPTFRTSWHLESTRHTSG